MHPNFLIAQFQPPSAYDVLVCTIGRRPMLKERMALVRDMWRAGLRAEILHETLEVLNFTVYYTKLI